MNNVLKVVVFLSMICVSGVAFSALLIHVPPGRKETITIKVISPISKEGRVVRTAVLMTFVAQGPGCVSSPGDNSVTVTGGDSLADGNLFGFPKSAPSAPIPIKNRLVQRWWSKGGCKSSNRLSVDYPSIN